MKPILFATATTAALLLAGLAMPAQAMIAAQISSGGDTTCAIVDNGHVTCWGSNRHYSLGAAVAPANMPRPVKVVDPMLFPLRNMVQVSVSPSDGNSSSPDQGSHGCAVSQAGEVWCWGRAVGGRLGTGSGTDDVYFANRVRHADGTPLTDVIQVAAGGAHTCALPRSGRVYCWGLNKLDNFTWGLLGQNRGYAAPKWEPHPLREHPVKAFGNVDLVDVVEIVAGRAHTCARLRGGGVRCWGSGAMGQLGRSGHGQGVVSEYAVSPIYANQSLELIDVRQLAAGSDHTCAIVGPGWVVCWGSNQAYQSGQLHGSVAANVVVVPTIDSPSPINNALAISAGGRHACITRGPGGGEITSVYCWGDNSHGQIGENLQVGYQSNYAREVTQYAAGEANSHQRRLSGIEQISAGQRHSCALHAVRRDVRCWGANHQGQRGLNHLNGGGDAYPIPRPADIVLGIDGIEIDAIFDNHFGYGVDHPIN